MKASGMNGSIRYQRRTTSEWEKLIARFEQTGQTRKSFCHTDSQATSTAQIARLLYCGVTKRPLDDVPLALWAIKAMLSAMGDTPQASTLLAGPASTLLAGPHIFPFDLPLPSLRELEACKALEIFRHGLDQEVLIGFL